MGKEKERRKIFLSPKGKIKRRRTKKDPITVEGYIQSDFFTKPYKLIVTATQKIWEKIEKIIFDNPSWFAHSFGSGFVYPALQERNKKKLRGRHKHTHYLVNQIKVSAGNLYALFSYLLKRAPGDQPGWLKSLINMASIDGFNSSAKGNKPQILTEYCIKKIYGESLQRSNNEIPLGELAAFLKKHKDRPTKEQEEQFLENRRLKLFEDPTSFYQTYIQADGRHRKFHKKYIEGKTPEEVANLAFTILDLKGILDSLK